MMKRILIVLCILALSLSTVWVLAEKRQAPDDQKVITTNDIPGFETVFRQYNAKFYDAPSQEPGTVVSLSYTTNVYGETMNQWANVYVPYGYDATKQYNIIYFFHGTNETQESFICNEKAKNVIDNIIDMGLCEPFLMVFPTYYYEYETRTVNHQLFPDEVRGDLIPAVESKYSTYAPTVDAEGFAASRDHRCISGYSQGSGACWNVSYKVLDWAKWIMPMSGNSVNNLDRLKEALTESGISASDIFVILCSGGKRDMAHEGTVALANAMIADEAFS
ncbi:MAG: hypothetical protein IKN04_02805, partial [Clostridia bacterium]|nr:hypothetical protein [Clostridia bacterium]